MVEYACLFIDQFQIHTRSHYLFEEEEFAQKNELNRS